MVKYNITAEWIEWINSNLERGCNKQSIFKTLLDKDYDYDSIKAILKCEYVSKEQEQKQQQEQTYNKPDRSRITDKWKAWIKENLNRECTKDTIFKMLLEEGFPYKVIKKELGCDFKDNKKIFTRKSMGEDRDHISSGWREWIKQNMANKCSKKKIFGMLLEEGFPYDVVKKELKCEFKDLKPKSENYNFNDSNYFNHDDYSNNNENYFNNTSTEKDTLKEEVQQFYIEDDYVADDINDIDDVDNVDNINYANNDYNEDESIELIYLDEVQTINKPIETAISHNNDYNNKYKNEYKNGDAKEKSILITSYAMPNYYNNDIIPPIYNAEIRKDAIKHNDANIYTINLFLLESECDAIKSGDSIIEKRISHAVGIDLTYSEPYKIIDDYPIETNMIDWIPPFTTEFEKSKQRGQITWTFLIFLNNNEVIFPRINASIQIDKGMALLWNNLYMDGSPNIKTEYQIRLKNEEGIIKKQFRTKQNANMKELTKVPDTKGIEIEDLFELEEYAKVMLKSE